ncbi:MAG: bifunctional diguanylate cyclase/phosphodiesterase [Lachnospiraceae bacterium]|nr:bifunctional diguanylate cyclase/phosphodiesterase [Lachnospiraceae bacterium]
MIKEGDADRSKVLDRTLDKLYEKKREVSTWKYVLLVVVYFFTNSIVSISASSMSDISFFGYNVPVYSFAGVFSSLANICVLILAMYFGEKGFFTALVVVVVQLPIIVINIILRHNLTSIPGVFNNLLTIIAICLVYFSNKKIRSVQKQMQDQAMKDVLTGLPNWFACTELVNQLANQRVPFAVVSVDLNGFKSVNDSMGIDTGNLVLMEIAARWKQIADDGLSGTLDFVARLSADEFSVIIRNYKSDEDILNTIKMYDTALEDHFYVSGSEFSISASFGYAVMYEDADTLEKLLPYADAAMREVKRQGSSNHIIRFKSDMASTEEGLQLESKVKAAIENGTVFYVLQPQFDMNHKLRGFEALARMKDEEGKLISTADFIPVAERCGLIDKLDGIVFRKASAFIGNIIRETGADIILSLNVSVRHLMMNSFPTEILQLLEMSGIPASQLEIEVTESIMIESMEKAKHFVEEIRNMGIQIAIDDFGTGYSSLSYLNSVPANLLKIDKSFIDEMNNGENSKAYVAAIISLGHIMGLDVISEGVEEEDQIDTLKEIGCDYIQGYVWGRPLSPEDAQKLVMESVK